MTNEEYLTVCGWTWRTFLADDLHAHVRMLCDPYSPRRVTEDEIGEALAIQLQRDRDRLRFVAEHSDDAREVMRRDWGEHRDGKS